MTLSGPSPRSNWKELVAAGLSVVAVVQFLGMFIQIVTAMNAVRDRVMLWVPKDSQLTEISARQHLFLNDWMSAYVGSVVACFGFGVSVLIIGARMTPRRSAVRTITTVVGGLFLATASFHGTMGWGDAIMMDQALKGGFPTLLRQEWLVGILLAIVAILSFFGLA